jgi:hypothetical protein
LITATRCHGESNRFSALDLPSIGGETVDHFGALQTVGLFFGSSVPGLGLSFSFAGTKFSLIYMDGWMAGSNPSISSGEQTAR